MRSAFEVATLLERSQAHWKQWGLNAWQQRTLHALRKCRTAALGGHIDQCQHPDCGRLHLSYNSCPNRHCPKCQGAQSEAWMQARRQDLLPVPYYHLVFTLPHQFNGYCLAKPREVYGILFKTAWEVVQGFARNPKFIGGQPGMIAILHTWGQNLSLHPHLHCLVPGGGLGPNNQWKKAKGKGKFLFPVKALSQVFRARFMAHFRKQFPQPGFSTRELFRKPWVVYCKRPFAGPEQVVEYLGRYTHKVALSNHRIQKIDPQEITIRAKNYRKQGKVYALKLTDQDFIKRFALHILPKGMVRIRHYGFLSGRNRKVKVQVIRNQLGPLKLPEIKDKQPLLPRPCPHCQKGQLLTISIFDSRGPPPHWVQKLIDDQPRPRKA